MSTEVEKRAEKSKRDAEVRAGLVEQEIAAKRQKTKDYRQVLQSEKEQKRLEDAKDIDGKTYWEKVKEDAHRMINDGVAGYNNWDTGMTNLMSRLMMLAKATWYDPIFPFRDQIVGTKNMVFDLVWDNTAAGLSDWVSKKRFADSDLPKIHVDAALNDDGELDVQVTKDKKVSNDPVFAQIKQKIDAGVVAWAMIHGYDWRADPTTNKYCFFHETDGSKMTHEVFEQLNVDPDSSIQAFLSGRFQMPLSTSFTPR